MKVLIILTSDGTTSSYEFNPKKGESEEKAAEPIEFFNSEDQHIKVEVKTEINTEISYELPHLQKFGKQSDTTSYVFYLDRSMMRNDGKFYKDSLENLIIQITSTDNEVLTILIPMVVVEL